MAFVFLYARSLLAFAVANFVAIAVVPADNPVVAVASAGLMLPAKGGRRTHRV